MIARAKSVAARSMVMFKTSDLRFQIVRGRRQVLHGRTTSRAWTHHQSCMIAGQVVARLVVLLVLPPDDWWCHLSYDLTIGSATSHDLSRLVARPYDWWYHQSLARRPVYLEWLLGFRSLSTTTPEESISLWRVYQCRREDSNLCWPDCRWSNNNSWVLWPQPYFSDEETSAKREEGASTGCVPGSRGGPSTATTPT